MTACQRFALSSILLFSAGAVEQDSNPSGTPPQVPQEKIIEAPNRRNIRAEQIFKTGDGPRAIDLAKLPQPPAEAEKEPPLLPKARWHNTEAISLPAKAKKTVRVDLAVPSLLLAKVSWHSTSAPVKLILLRGTTVVAEGSPVILSPGMGTASLQTTLATAGRFVVSIENTGGSVAEINVAIASVPQADRTGK